MEAERAGESAGAAKTSSARPAVCAPACAAQTVGAARRARAAAMAGAPSSTAETASAAEVVGAGADESKGESERPPGKDGDSVSIPLLEEVLRSNKGGGDGGGKSARRVCGSDGAGVVDVERESGIDVEENAYRRRYERLRICIEPFPVFLFPLCLPIDQPLHDICPLALRPHPIETLALLAQLFHARPRAGNK